MARAFSASLAKDDRAARPVRSAEKKSGRGALLVPFRRGSLRARADAAQRRRTIIIHFAAATLRDVGRGKGPPVACNDVSEGPKRAAGAGLSALLRASSFLPKGLFGPRAAPRSTTLPGELFGAARADRQTSSTCSSSRRLQHRNATAPARAASSRPTGRGDHTEASTSDAPQQCSFVGHRGESLLIGVVPDGTRYKETERALGERCALRCSRDSIA